MTTQVDEDWESGFGSNWFEINAGCDTHADAARSGSAGLRCIADTAVINDIASVGSKKLGDPRSFFMEMDTWFYLPQADTVDADFEVALEYFDVPSQTRTGFSVRYISKDNGGNADRFQLWKPNPPSNGEWSTIFPTNPLNLARATWHHFIYTMNWHTGHYINLNVNDTDYPLEGLYGEEIVVVPWAASGTGLNASLLFHNLESTAVTGYVDDFSLTSYKVKLGRAGMGMGMGMGFGFGVSI